MQAQMRAIMDAQKVLFPNVLGSYNVIAGWGNFVLLLTDVCLMGLRYSRSMIGTRPLKYFKNQWKQWGISES
ncbi:hypothetical protein LINGRAHAP2_LOCUS6946 [Linum grandiflorum]